MNAAPEWLDFGPHSEMPASHESVCKTCFLVGNKQLIVAGDCPNCWENF